MAEIQTPSVAEVRVNSQDLNRVKDWVTGEPIGTRTAKAFYVQNLQYSWSQPEPVFIVWDDNSLQAIMDSPAMKAHMMVKAAQNAGEQVALEDLPTTNGRPLMWNGFAVLEGEELARTLATANETYCDRGPWAGSPEGEMMQAHWPTKVQTAVALLRAGQVATNTDEHEGQWYANL